MSQTPLLILLKMSDYEKGFLILAVAFFASSSFSVPGETGETNLIQRFVCKVPGLTVVNHEMETSGFR
jgi:hypothetical protein